MASALLVTDMHLLPGEEPEQMAELVRLLDAAREARAIYCLGDTFNYWYEKGDRFLESYRGVCAAFAAAVADGVRVFFIPGNRDSYMGSVWAAQTRATLLPLTHVLEHDGRRYLLTHGDMFCTGDWWFQCVRRHFFYGWGRHVVRAVLPWSVAMRIVRPIAYGRGHLARQGTVGAASRVEPEALLAAAKAHDVQVVVCGHTHCPETTILSGDGETVELRVLAPWCDTHAWMTLS